MLSDFLLMAPGPGGSGGGSGSILGMLLPFLLMFVVLYFLMIRPQQKRAKEHQKMLTELKKGDRVVTTGGMFGTVFGFPEDESKIIIKVSDEVKLEFMKSSIAQKVG